MHTFTQPLQHGQMEIGGIRLDTSTSARVKSWRYCFEDFLKKPLLGYGVTGCPFMDAQLPRILLESGLIGLVAFLNLLYRIFRLAHHRLKESTDYHSKGLLVGYLSGFIALIFQSVATNAFTIVRIMEPFWLFTGIMVVLPHLRPEAE